jgi:hypothetical protein
MKRSSQRTSEPESRTSPATTVHRGHTARTSRKNPATASGRVATGWLRWLASFQVVNVRTAGKRRWNAATAAR